MRTCEKRINFFMISLRPFKHFSGLQQILHMDLSPHSDQIPHVDQIPQKDQNPHMIIIGLTLLFRREDLRAMNMCIFLQIIMFISPRRISLLIHMLTLTPLM